MRALLLALVLISASASTALAAHRPRRHPVCVPTFFEGVGNVLICAPPPRRR